MKTKNKQTEFEAPSLLIAALNAIEEELKIVWWNIYQEEIDNPFDNTGGSYKNNVFSVKAYNWKKNQDYNFKWKDIKIKWYKYLGRDTTVNKKISPKIINELLCSCLLSLKLFEKKYDNKRISRTNKKL